MQKSCLSMLSMASWLRSLPFKLRSCASFFLSCREVVALQFEVAWILLQLLVLLVKKLSVSIKEDPLHERK